jgi:heme-degrading monooxygenase HmoA
MTEIYTMGRWRPETAKEDAFVEAWAEFAAWASGLSGAGTLRLARDVRDPGAYISFAMWEGVDSVRAWKSGAEFRERLARVVQHVAEFEPTELAVVATAEAGGSSVDPAPVDVEPVHAV